MPRRPIIAVIAALTALTISACGSGAKHSRSGASGMLGAGATTGSASGGSPAPASSNQPDGLVGLGARDSAWEATHQEDPTYGRGSAYDPAPSLAGARPDRYFNVQHAEGRVLGYTLVLPSGTSIGAARHAALQELPHDAKTRWFQAKDTCAQMLVASDQLGRSLGAAPIDDPTGTVLVEFTSGVSGSYYDASNISLATLLLSAPKSPGRAPTC